MNIDLRKIWPDLLCLVPVYARDGTNGTEIRLENQAPVFSPFKTKTLVRRLARHFTFDLRAAYRKYAEVSARRYALPLPLHPDLVLIPVCARRARVKDDGTRAYVVKGKIAGIAAGAEPGWTRFLFVDRTHLDVPQRYDSLEDLLVKARLIEREAASLFGSRSYLRRPFAGRPGTGRPESRLWGNSFPGRNHVRVAERSAPEWPVGGGSGRSGRRPEQPQG
ncbi:MAG: hypothetical protein QHH75_07105 [Bacillota bacterium]|nr:hypothetical protein [Bacillota bacterium]